MGISIDDLWMTQRNFQRYTDIPSLIELYLKGDPWYDRILIKEACDGELEIINGHHRVMALHLCGVIFLPGGSYTLVISDDRSPRFGKLVNQHRVKDQIYELLESAWQYEAEVPGRTKVLDEKRRTVGVSRYA